MLKPDFFRIFTTFDTLLEEEVPEPIYYQAICNGIRHVLKKLLPDYFFDRKWQAEKSPENVRKKMLAMMPVVKSTQNDRLMCFYSFYRHRENAFKFFFDLVSQWLVPGKKLNVVLLYTADFQLPELGDEVFTICEVIIKADAAEDRDLIERNFPLIETDAKIGLESDHYARKIFELRGVLNDQKTSLIQQRIALAIKRFPASFSSDIFTEMQHILVTCDDDFKEQRTVMHLSRVIGVQYFFRRQLLKWLREFPQKRNVVVKVFSSEVNFPQGKKHVLALVIGLNLRGKEVFEQRNLVKAIQQYIPTAAAIDQTYFTNRRGSEKIMTVYLEIEKGDNKKFSSDEIRKLKNNLPNDLQKHIGLLLPPVFMPRNEEEIMRNILSLSQQIKYLRDIPQVFITFDEQTERNVFFTVIAVRVLQKGMESIHDLVRKSSPFFRYIHDRTKTVGYLRQKYAKEATVFRLKFAKESFLRGDHSIDLYKARQSVVNELTRCIGEFRDFNGGMIAKQNELLAEVKSLFADEKVAYDEILLENLFYSLVPVIMRTVLDSSVFKKFFEKLLKAIEEGIPEGDKTVLKYFEDAHATYLIVIGYSWVSLDEIAKTLHKFNSGGTDLVQGHVKTAEFACMGYILMSSDPKKQEQFLGLVMPGF